jgi:hypothetical protein
MAVQGSDSDAGSPCHVLERCVDAAFREDGIGSRQQRLPVAAGVGARLAPGGRGVVHNQPF